MLCSFLNSFFPPLISHHFYFYCCVFEFAKSFLLQYSPPQVCLHLQSSDGSVCLLCLLGFRVLVSDGVWVQHGGEAGGTSGSGGRLTVNLDLHPLCLNLGRLLYFPRLWVPSKEDICYFSP